MAVKKNNASPVEDEAMVKAKDAGEPETERLIYIGPSLPGAALKCNRIFEGTREHIQKELAAVFEKYPLAKNLLVPVAGLAEKKDMVRTAGNILNKYYSDLVSVTAAVEREG